MSIYLDSELGIPFNQREPELIVISLDLVAKDDVVFDIGARFGYYTLLLERDGANVHAFEPHPHNVSRLRENISLNGLEHRVTVIPQAVADSRGEVDLVLGEDSTHSIDSDRSGETIPVESTTIDDYLRLEGGIPDLVKIDVEGAGERVLRGAAGTIDRNETTWIMEIHNDWERRSFEENFYQQSYATKVLKSGHLVARPSENSVD